MFVKLRKEFRGTGHFLETFSVCSVDTFTLAKKTTLAQAYKFIFGLKTDFNLKKKKSVPKSRNDQYHAHYQQTKFQISDLSL